MMIYVGILLLMVGVALLVVGYRRSNRNLLLASAIVLFLSCALGDFAHGFGAGWNAAYGATGTTQSSAAVVAMRADGIAEK